MVGGDIRHGKDGSKLMLSGCDLVMLGLGEYAELPQLLVKLIHKGGDSGLYRAEVVVVQLLPLGRLCAEKSPARIAKILAPVIHSLIYKEILLLRADGGLYALVFLTEKLQNTHRLPADRLH